MDERDLVARGVFGALYRRPDGKVAGVGTAMRVAAHDVIIDGKLLSVYGEGDFRFKVLRVRQVNPYLVVDAVPLTDAGSGPEASGPEAAESDPGRIDSRAVANNVVASGLGGGRRPGRRRRRRRRLRARKRRTKRLPTEKKRRLPKMN